MLEYGNNSYFETDSESIYITYIRRDRLCQESKKASLSSLVYITQMALRDSKLFHYLTLISVRV